MKRTRLRGILLILAGVAIAAILLTIFLSGLYERWLRFSNNGYWDTFWDYFWQVGKTNMCICIFAGMIPVCVGIYYLHRK